MSDSKPRIYGTADDDNGQTPPAGFGSQSAPPADDPELQHDVAVAGNKVMVQEDSGVAFVEASGAPGPTKTQDKPASE